MRPWLIGMNSPNGLPPLDPRGGTARRLMAILGMTERDYRRTFRRANVLNELRWDRHRACLRGLRLRSRLSGLVLVLGRETWTCLRLPPVGYLERVDRLDRAGRRQSSFILLPHTSGRCRLLNDEALRERVRSAVLEALDESSAAGAGSPGEADPSSPRAPEARRGPFGGEP